MEDGEPTVPPALATGTAAQPGGRGRDAAATDAVTPAPDERKPAPEGPSSFRLGNRPCLTGIRAVGIIAVLAYHSNFKTLPGTWTMLDMFFVLSGFLITAMLNGEGRRNGRISMRAFYARRAARLLPPLVLTIALIGIYAAFVYVADAGQRIWGDSAAAMFYYSDYRQAFGHEPFFGFLSQAWSLSIEEQFYIIWSVLLLAAVAAGRRRLAYGFAIVGIAASVADRLYLALSAPHFDTAVFTRIYYAFDTRADALFLGCLLGLLASDGYLDGWKRGVRQLVAVAAAASAVFIGWILWNAPLFREGLVIWQLPVSTVAWAILIVYFVVSPAGPGSRLVGLGILVFVGDLSYTIYLVHFPVYLAVQPNGTHWGYWPTELVRLAIIFAIAIASWFLIERPLLRWRQRSADRSGSNPSALPATDRTGAGG